MNFWACAALVGLAFAAGRAHARQRTRADLQRLTDLIVAACPPERERAILTELHEGPNEAPRDEA